ncbi:CENPA [Cordylochernes scorpioides]|uniref:CENPA n=1 Tax=Cordylochernes scorpioides TaxID=51811 RepID=A0ABY6LFY3_9ARAC|nr:CENPA [Cordylochernes scorpioides]
MLQWPPIFAKVQPHQRVQVTKRGSGTFYGTPAQSTAAETIQFEPLPDIHSRWAVRPSSTPPRPAYYSLVVADHMPLQDWFEDPQSNFPRSQLQYLRELGAGWFGRVVEGEAQGLVPGGTRSPVVVRILREDASPSDHMYFLHDAQLYRDMEHPNILRLFGHCLETDPFLIIMEYCPMNRKNADMLLQQGILLSMAFNIASALQYMHERGYVHMDLAARNCLVTAGGQVKSDYYYLGSVALPLRWCSPECLVVADTTIEFKRLTRESNIWSFGVLVWELLEFGTLPYPSLSDDQVLQKVVVERSVGLERPKISCPFRDHIYQVIQLCSQSPEDRPSIHKLVCYFSHLKDHQGPEDNMKFEDRWNAIQAAAGAEVNHDLHSMVSGGVPSLQFESNFVVGPLSGSLQNLRGSLEDLGTSSYSSICEDIMALRADLTTRPPEESLDSWNKNLDSLNSLDLQLTRSQQNVSEFFKLTLIDGVDTASSDSDNTTEQNNNINHVS